jgi:molecular chaperone GrpE
MPFYSTPFPLSKKIKFHIWFKPLREVSKLTVEKNTAKNDELLEEENNVELTEEKSAAEEAEKGEDSANPAEHLLELQNQNSLLETKLEEFENRYLRLQADFDNFRRRSRLEIEANEKYRAQKLIVDILPSIDNFERALKMESEQSGALIQGMDMVYRGLLDALSKEGLQAIEAVGKEFDPHLHQAVMQGEDANFGSNIVIEEFQKGYMLKDRVIRPSMVKVNQ